MADHPLGDMMSGAMDKIRGMVDANMVVGQPITTHDGVTLVPVSRISFGFASGGNDGSDASKKGSVWAGSGAAVKVDPVGFLMMNGTSIRMVAVQPPAFSTADRIIDLVPGLLDRVERMADKYAPKTAASDEADGTDAE